MAKTLKKWTEYLHEAGWDKVDKTSLGAMVSCEMSCVVNFLNDLSSRIEKLEEENEFNSQSIEILQIENKELREELNNKS